MLRDTAPGASLRIVKRGEVLWERKGADKPPRLASGKAALSKTGDLELAWKVETSTKDPVEVWVRWSTDDAETWHALTIGLHGGRATLPAEQLPSGKVRFELLAHDGFHTARATTESILLPPHAPAVAIHYPGVGARVHGDRLIHLWGSATSHGGQAIDPDACEWLLDDKSAAHGLDVWIENPGAGRHVLRLIVREGTMEGSADVEFVVIDDGKKPA